MKRIADWPTTIAVIPCLGIMALLYFRVVTTKDALELLAGVGAYLAAVSGGTSEKKFQ